VEFNNDLDCELRELTKDGLLKLVITLWEMCGYMGRTLESGLLSGKCRGFNKLKCRVKELGKNYSIALVLARMLYYIATLLAVTEEPAWR